MKTRDNQPHTNCKLEKIRTESKESLDDLSRAVGMSASCLHKLQQGRDPKLMMALKIASHYERSLEEIWPDTKTLLRGVAKCKIVKSKSAARTAAKSKQKKNST